MLNAMTLVSTITAKATTSKEITNLYSSSNYYFVVRTILSTGRFSDSNQASASTTVDPVTDDANNLIVPAKVRYTLSGSQTYANSIQIYGILQVKEYDGSAGSGTLELHAPTITVFSEGAIIGDAAGYVGGAEGGRRSSVQSGRLWGARRFGTRSRKYWSERRHERW